MTGLQWKKGRDLTQYYDKNYYTHKKIKKAKWQHKNANKILDYTTIADRFTTVSMSNDSYPTGMVKTVNGIPTFPLTATVL